MKNLKFKKGDFITEISSNNGSFAVFEGETYAPSVKGGPNEYSLMCFFNPEHYEQDSNGNYKAEYIFECDVDDDTCQYIIDDNDMGFWRVCTESEKREALKFLAEIKKIAFDENDLSFRKLKDNERINFGERRDTRNLGSENSMISPFYRGAPAVSKEEKPTKLITRYVSENWEQKEPITNMTYEHSELILDLCKKIRMSFSYSDDYYGNLMYGWDCYD